MITIKNKNYYLGSQKITDSFILDRIKKLRVPPAWTDVEISSDPTSYVQVTGKDVSGKVQYIYHPLFVTLTEYHKYSRLKEFCSRLHLLTNRIKSIKKRSINDRLYLIALMFRLMSKTHARIGNDNYIDDDDPKKSSYGLTTLNSKHIIIND